MGSYFKVALSIMLLSGLAVGCSNRDLPNSTSISSGVEPLQAERISSSPDVQKVTFFSQSLGKEMNFNIYLPEGDKSQKKYPVLYMIHGYGANENQWLLDLGMAKIANKMLEEGKIKPLIIVSPQIDKSYGFNSTTGGRYSDYITIDLVQYIDSHFSTNAVRESRYIGGLSMGGWAALHNAFLHPELYSKVGGHSPALFLDDWGNTGGLEDWLYPSEEHRQQRDPLFLAESEDLNPMSVYLDSGEEDSYKFYQGAEVLFHKLQSQNVSSEYHHSPGGHDGDYWISHMGDYLLFYSGK